jgi:hypothetical protein
MVSLLKAEFEHVQLSAEYAWSGRLSRSFLNAFRKCGSGADWEDVDLVCYCCGAVKTIKRRN